MWFSWRSHFGFALLLTSHVPVSTQVLCTIAHPCFLLKTLPITTVEPENPLLHVKMNCNVLLNL